MPLQQSYQILVRGPVTPQVDLTHETDQRLRTDGGIDEVPRRPHNLLQRVHDLPESQLARVALEDLH